MPMSTKVSVYFVRFGGRGSHIATEDIIDLFHHGNKEYEQQAACALFDEVVMFCKMMSKQGWKELATSLLADAVERAQKGEK